LRIDDFKRKLRTACLALNFPEERLIQESVGSVKLRIEFSRYGFIDVYFSERTATLNSALVEGGIEY